MSIGLDMKHEFEAVEIDRKSVDCMEHGLESLRMTEAVKIDRM